MNVYDREAKLAEPWMINAQLMNEGGEYWNVHMD